LKLATKTLGKRNYGKNLEHCIISLTQITVDYHGLAARLPFPWRALFHLAHVHLKAFIVDDNKSLCRLAGTPLAALCSADSRWSGKTTEPTPFLGRPEKGVKDKRGSFVDAFYETRADPRQPLASVPSFEGVGARDALSDRRERDAHPFDNTPGVHLATPPPRPPFVGF